MFSDTTHSFDAQMIGNHLMKDFKNPSSSSSFWSDDEHDDDAYCAVNGIKTRIIWITNYISNEDFPMHVPADDPLRHIINEKDVLHTPDLSQLNLDDLLLLLYRLQQRSSKTPLTTSNSSISSSSSADRIHRSSSIQPSSPTLPHIVQSSFTLSNIADVPKQLMTTLTKPIPSFHSPNTKHIHSPNDVVDKLLQSFHLRNTPKFIERRSSQYSPSYSYQESQQHKAKLISNLLSSTSNLPHCRREKN